MAIKLEANYSKKIGLAGFSSHQFSVTLTTEITDLSKVQDESDRLYSLLQSSVDHSIQSVGYLPEQNGHAKSNGNGNGLSNGNHPKPPARANTPVQDWKCTVKQKDLILKVVDENKLDKNQVEDLSQKRFGKGVRDLNRLEASGLIAELLELYPNQPKSR